MPNAANDGPVSASELVTFVREHFFKDPQLARQHPGSGKAYWAALARLVLKRFLLLAALLDRVAQLPTLPSAAPLLFRRDSKLKTSVQVGTAAVQLEPMLCDLFAERLWLGIDLPLLLLSDQVLTEFVLPRLAGEGDVVRTLGRLGYKLAYVQDPRRELDFAGVQSCLALSARCLLGHHASTTCAGVWRHVCLLLPGAPCRTAAAYFVTA